MVKTQPVASLDLPELAPYRTMQRQQEQRDQGIFVAEGEKVVRRLLESGLEVISLLLPEKWFHAYAELLVKRPEPSINVFTADRKSLEKLTGFSMYQGVLAVARVPSSVSLRQVMDQADRPHLFVAVDGLSSAENLGGLVRSAAAFGAHGFIAGETCCSPYLRRSVRSSMGTIFTLPVIEPPSLIETLREAKSAGLRLVAAHPHTDQRELARADLRSDCLIVLGSEGWGLSSDILGLCDEQVLIPMHGGVDSLNVGTAGAIFLYEARRQRSDPH